jgi:hypothetical protein
MSEIDTVEEFFSQFKEEGKIWPDGLLVKLRNGNFEKVFAVLPSASYDEPDYYIQTGMRHLVVIGTTYSAIFPWTWKINGAYFDPCDEDDDREFYYKKDIVEIYSGKLLAKTEGENHDT